MGFFKKVSKGLSRSRSKFKERMNVLLDRGPDLDEGFWDQLEETLILSDVGGSAAASIVEGLRDQATRDALPDAYAVLDLLNDQIAATFTPGGEEILGGDPACVVFVGINGTGKTTTVGKLAKEAHDAGRTVVLGSADTFRAAAIEQLEVWARRADVEVVERERGADPASVCYDTIERGEQKNADLVLIDTAGRLHNSADLMRELEKVVSVVRKRSTLPVYIVLVIDATTGQNGLAQAREFNRTLDLDGIIITKLDGTAKGGIALAVSHELELPILKIGVGEGIDDLRDFDAHEYSSALIGDFDERYDDDEDDYETPVDVPRTDERAERPADEGGEGAAGEEGESASEPEAAGVADVDGEKAGADAEAERAAAADVDETEAEPEIAAAEETAAVDAEAESAEAETDDQIAGAGADAASAGNAVDEMEEPASAGAQDAGEVAGEPAPATDEASDEAAPAADDEAANEAEEPADEAGESSDDEFEDASKSKKKHFWQRWRKEK
ncbi:MAG: signal recognition particle-docking protein FtsY [Eggerthellaceae bacterium]|jgi:fused signal recognition particle receptor